MKLFADLTWRSIKFDVTRLRARLHCAATAYGFHRPTLHPRLHLGCGRRKVAGWLNVDISHSDWNVDLAYGVLPWADASFEAVVAQQVIEHLDLEGELIPLLRECARVLQPKGCIWLSCPDMEKVCRGYIADKGKALYADIRSRHQGFTLGDMPEQHVINYLFHQRGEHRNLMDLDLLTWALSSAGFSRVERKTEAQLISEFNGFPARHDDFQSLLVRAMR